MVVSEEELAWALDTHIDFARAVLGRIRARQRREPYDPLPAKLLREAADRYAQEVNNQWHDLCNAKLRQWVDEEATSDNEGTKQ